MSAEHSERWRRHETPHTPLYHWGPTKPDGTRPHHYGTADPDKCPFCRPLINAVAEHVNDNPDCGCGLCAGTDGGPDAA